MIRSWRTFTLAVSLLPLAVGLWPGAGIAAGLEPPTAIHILDLGTGAWTRVGPGLIAIWSADGRQLAFSEPRRGPEGHGYAWWDGRFTAARWPWRPAAR